MSAKYAIYRLARRVVRLPFLNALIPSGLRRRLQQSLGSSLIDQFPDRRYMEAHLLPTIAAMKPPRLLDVGVESYTRHYGSFFGPEVERWTLDLNPLVTEFGAPGRHLVANALDIADHFEPQTLDVVLFNGPFGYGVDRADEQLRVLEGARKVLRSGGWMLIGWDRALDGKPLIAAVRGQDYDEATRVRDPIEIPLLREQFVHEGPLGLPARKEFPDSSHVYDWFRAR